MNWAGNWPNQVPDFYARDECVAFCESVKILCSGSSNALVVHGTGGIGKTTLTVFSLRQTLANQLASSDFGSIDHCIWLNVGQVSAEQKFDDDAFFQQLYQVLRNCSVIESASNYLDLANELNGTRYLFVLDDVFNSGVLRCMSKFSRDNVKVIALTRNLTKAKYENAWFKCSEFPVNFMSDESIENMLHDFYKLGAKGLDRKSQIKRLTKICLGLPLIASVVNSQFCRLQCPNRIQSRFWALVRNFKDVASSEVLVDKFGDCDEAQLRISKLLTLSPELESESLRLLLYNFILFKPGQPVNFKDLQIVCKCKEGKTVEQCYEEAVEANFIQRQDQGYYTMHDLLRKAMIDRASEDFSLKDERSVKERIVDVALEREGRNSLEWAISDERIELLQIFNEFGQPQKLANLCEADRTLQKLAEKIAKGELWIKEAGKSAETSFATELYCLLAELCLNFDIIPWDESEDVAVIANTMSGDPKTWYENVLFAAIKLNCWKMTGILLQYEETRELAQKCRDLDGNNALLIAAIYGQLECLKVILQKGNFDLNHRNVRGETALWYCMAFGEDTSLRMLEELCGKGDSRTKIDVNMADFVVGNTPLHRAINYSRLELVKFLIEEAGADGSIKNALNNANALEMAAGIRESFEITEYLVSIGKLKMEAVKLADAIKRARTGGNEKMETLLESLVNKSDLSSDEDGESLEIMVQGGEMTEIHEAAEANDLEALRRMLQEHPQQFANHVCDQDEYGQSALMMASCEGKFEAAEFLLQNGAVENIDAYNDEGCTALGMACQNGHLEVARLLLANGASVDACLTTGDTPLANASLNHETAIVQILLENGANPQKSTSRGGWPLFVTVCQKGYSDIAELLLNFGADVDCKSKDGTTALCLACQNGHSDTVALLLKRGADVAIVQKNQWPALMFACQIGNLSNVSLLLQHGADVNKRASVGSVPLIVSSQQGHSEVVKLLLENGALVDAQKDDGWAAIHYACQHGRFEVAKLLLDYGCNYDLAENDGWTGLMLASQNGHVETVRLLLDRGADMELVEKGYWTALMSSCLNGRFNAAKLLLERGASVDHQADDGTTALMLACYQNHVDMVNLLLDFDASIDACRTDGRTALMLAAQNGMLEIVEFLLQKGASINACDKTEGCTALMLACDEGETEVVKKLLLHGADKEIASKSSKNALGYASEKQFGDILSLLGNPKL